MYVKCLFLVEWCGVDSPSVGLTMHFSFALNKKPIALVPLQLLDYG